MVTIKAKIKEVNNDHILTPSYMVSDEEEKYLSDAFFVNFWGLDHSDVEWYKLERERDTTGESEPMNNNHIVTNQIS